MLLREVMKKVISVPGDMSVAVAAKVMEEHNFSSLPVERDGEIVGIITERDIVRRVVARQKNAQLMAVEDIMTPDLVTLDSGVDITVANDVMLRYRIRRVLVTEKNQIVGIVSMRDVSRYLRYVIGQKMLRSREEEFVGNVY